MLKIDTNRGECNKLILIIKNIVQQKEYVENIWIDILISIFLLNMTVVLPLKENAFNKSKTLSLFGAKL